MSTNAGLEAEYVTYPLNCCGGELTQIIHWAQVHACLQKSVESVNLLLLR